MNILKKPSAWIPIVLSLGMLVFMATLFMLHGVPTPQENQDEGVGAHLFQIWLVLEAFMILFFAGRWVPQKPKPALLILAIQILLVLAGCFPVFYFHL